ncbi:RNA-directed DNA polymerase from mobile element jockey-like protein, partial [Clarias magur]
MNCPRNQLCFSSWKSLFFLRQLTFSTSDNCKKQSYPRKFWYFDYYVIENLMTYGLSVWFNSCTKAKQHTLQRVIKNTTNIIRVHLPGSCPIYDSNCLCHLLSAIRDHLHPAHHVFT